MPAANFVECDTATELLHDWMRPYTWAEPWDPTVKDQVRTHLTTCPTCQANRRLAGLYLDERRAARPERAEGIVRE